MDKSRTETLKIYIKNKKYYDGPGIYIGRPSVFGNPYTHLINSNAIYVKTRKEAIEKYKTYFEKEFITNEHLQIEFHELKIQLCNEKELTLICHCKPLSCHGDFLKEKIIEEFKDNFPELKVE